MVVVAVVAAVAYQDSRLGVHRQHHHRIVAVVVAAVAIGVGMLDWPCRDCSIPERHRATAAAVVAAWAGWWVDLAAAAEEQHLRRDVAVKAVAGVERQTASYHVVVAWFAVAADDVVVADS